MRQSADYGLEVGEFERAIAGRAFGETTKDVTRRLLVDGWPVHKIVKEYGVSRSRVYAMRDQVYAAYLMSANYPPDWVSVKLTGPADLLDEFAERLETLRTRLVLTKRVRQKK